MNEPVETNEYPFVQRKSSLTARGYVHYVNVMPRYRNGWWVCDECGDKVIPSRFTPHAKDHHLYRSAHG